MVRIHLSREHSPGYIILLRFNTNRVINACIKSNYKGLELGVSNRFHKGTTIIPSILAEFK
jgi:hypothetical protein